MKHSPLSFVLTTVLGLTLIGSVLAQPADPPPAKDGDSTRGISRTEKAPAVVGPKYRKHWALVIGINHEDKRPEADRSTVPELKNARNDATDFHKLLVDHYGFSGENGDAVLLLEKDATHANIRKYLSESYLCDPKRVSNDDCVVVFFAGHGLVMPDAGVGKNRGVILPQDVEIVNNKPTMNSVIWMQNDLMGMLNACPARHKLLILDCCHSGEIFNRDDLPAAIQPEEYDHRNGAHLFQIPGFIAMASCRERQPAQDGRDANSPFTKVLLQALRTIPLREGREAEPFSSFQLFKSMRPELRLPGGQDPVCRCLKGDGEFRFFPVGNFAPFANRSIETKLLQAMNPGEHGNWWFEESPWLLPSVRRMILDEQDVSRNLIPSQIIQTATLRKCATQALVKLKSSSDPVRKMRAEHLSQLLQPKRGKSLNATLEAMHDELSAAEDRLEATDLHFLAVIRHFLGKPRARITYENAIGLYVQANKDGAGKLDYRPLEALCRSDFAHYLSENEGDHSAAIDEFERARLIFGLNAPVPFSMFLLCRQADCYQRMDRWAESNERFALAAERLDHLETEHPLTAFFFRRRALAKLEQWKIVEAAKDFESSNERLINANGSAALTGKLHNRHGIAIALRFQGRSDEASVRYREILKDIAESLLALRDGKLVLENGTDVRSQLLDRWVNTHERLADCNMFSPIGIRDLKEGVEDLRKAIRSVDNLRAGHRSREKIRMLYKLSIMLSMPEPGSQDHDLAKAYCHQADELFNTMLATPSKDTEFYHSLAPRIVELYRVGDSAITQKLEALAALRKEIVNLRASLTENIQRDRLEFLMFASKILVEESVAVDRFNTLEDTEILMGLCRKTMLSQTDTILDYLRQYYDAGVRARLAMQPKNVKGLLEIQKAATTGQFYIKPAEPAPVLALYVLGDQTYLFFDVPRGLSKHYVLPDDYTRERLHEAMKNSDKRLVLPREVVKTLEELALRPGPGGMIQDLKVHCWLDGTIDASGGKTSVVRVAGGSDLNLDFPFSLPRNVTIANLAVPGMPAVARRNP